MGFSSTGSVARLCVAMHANTLLCAKDDSEAQRQLSHNLAAAPGILPQAARAWSGTVLLGVAATEYFVSPWSCVVSCALCQLPFLLPPWTLHSLPYRLRPVSFPKPLVSIAQTRFQLAQGRTICVHCCSSATILKTRQPAKTQARLRPSCAQLCCDCKHSLQ